MGLSRIGAPQTCTGPYLVDRIADNIATILRHIVHDMLWYTCGLVVHFLKMHFIVQCDLSLNGPKGPF